jgi:hypothetical protein
MFSYSNLGLLALVITPEITQNASLNLLALPVVFLARSQVWSGWIKSDNCELGQVVTLYLSLIISIEALGRIGISKLEPKDDVFAKLEFRDVTLVSMSVFEFLYSKKSV